MRYWTGLAWTMGLVLATPAMGQEWAGDAIPHSLSGSPGDPNSGRVIVASRKSGLCLLCHSGPFPEERFQGNLAPDLTMSVAQLSEGQLRARLLDASKTNPSTIMPSYFRTDQLTLVATAYAGKTLLTAQEIEDVIAFLLTLKQP